MKTLKKSLVHLLFIALSISLVSATVAQAKNGAGSGRTTIGADLGDNWTLGVGQPTGNFTTASRNGLEVGLRPVERYGDFNLPVAAFGRVAVYTVPSGVNVDGQSAWGFSIYVNVENAFGVAAGTTLADYDIVVTQNYDANGNWFGLEGIDSTNYFDLEAKTPTGIYPGFGNDDPYKYQQSWAPTFGTTGFDATVEGVYEITLTLVPATFRGAPLSVTVLVNAVAP